MNDWTDGKNKDCNMAPSTDSPDLNTHENRHIDLSFSCEVTSSPHLFTDCAHIETIRNHAVFKLYNTTEVAATTGFRDLYYVKTVLITLCIHILFLMSRNRQQLPHTQMYASNHSFQTIPPHQAYLHNSETCQTYLTCGLLKSHHDFLYSIKSDSFSSPNNAHLT